MVNTRTASILAAVLASVALLSACSSPPPDPDRTAWDQARVTELARQLADAISKLRNTTLLDPGMRNPTGPNRQAAMLYLENLRDLEASTGQLARRLEAGGGFDDTLGVARRIGTLLRDAQTSGRRTFTSAAQWAAIDPAVEIINEISPYYSSSSPLMPRSTER